MTLKIALFASIVLFSSLAERVWATEFCDTLEEVAGEAQDRFRKYRAGRDDTGEFKSSKFLPGAKECYIESSEGELICTWPPKLGNDAERDARLLIDGIRACFPGGKYKVINIPRGIVAGNVYTYKIRSISFSVKADARDNDVALTIGRDD